MIMKNLYEEMKDALDFFGLNFKDMDKVQVSLADDGLCFTYNDRIIVITREAINVN